MSSTSIKQVAVFLRIVLPIVLIATVGIIFLLPIVRKYSKQAQAARLRHEFTETARQIPLAYGDWSGEIWESDPESLEFYNSKEFFNSKYEDGWIYWTFNHKESDAEFGVLLCRGHPAEISRICVGCETETTTSFVVASDVGIVPFQLGRGPDFEKINRQFRMHRTWTTDGSWLARQFVRNNFKHKDRPFCFALVSKYKKNNIEKLDRQMSELARFLLPEIQQAFFMSSQGQLQMASQKQYEQHGIQN